MILNIGCGDSTKKGEVGLDIRKMISVNIIADAHMLPFKDESFNRIFSSHLIEHFSHQEITKVFVEWVRVLKRDCIIEIRCPDLRARALLFFLNPTWSNIKNIYGREEYSEDYHKCGFYFQLLKSLLESCGISNIKRIIDGYKGIPFIPNCLHITGIKR